MEIDPDLTLEKAKGMVRQQEAMQEQQGILHGDTKPSVDVVRHAYTHSWKPVKPPKLQEVPEKG